MIEKFEIPAPPLPEQKRIVAKVDELMALCDRLEAQQQERQARHADLARASLARFAAAPTPSNLHFLFHKSYTIPPADLRKSILTLAVQGKLVPQDPKDEPASNLKEFHRAELNGLEMPASWRLAMLTEVAETIVDCPHSTPKWTTSGKICVRTNQFRPGLLDLSATQFVSKDTFEDRIQRLRPQADDILYSREGGILGIACRVPPNVELCLGQRMMLIRASRSIAPAYLELVLNAPLITEIARRQTTGGAAPRVNVSTVKSYTIPCPPLAEQRRIVAKVEQLMALVDELETQLAASRATAKNLLVAIVAELTETRCTMTTTPPDSVTMQSSSASDTQDEAPVRFTDASTAPTGIGTMQLTPEDVIGLMGLRYAKCQIAPARPDHNWDMTLAVERPGLPPRYLMEYLLGPNPDPFFLACKWPKPGANQIDFYHAYTWQVTFCENLENPACTHFNLRGSYPETPLKAGKWVVLLWSNPRGTGWDPESIDYVQRVVLELRELPRQDD